MKKIIATGRNYNSLQMLVSVTFFYEDSTSKTYELLSKKTDEKDFDVLKDIVARINKVPKED